MGREVAAASRRTGQSTTVSAAQVERLDKEIIKLVNQRAKLASQLAKQNAGAPREETILARLEELNRGPLATASLRAIFRELISGTRALTRTIKVSFLGPAYSYSHLATLEHFGQSIELAPVGSISAVFEEVIRGHATYGVVPIENSTDGRIADTLDMFTRSRVRICGEVHLRIHHTLLGKCPRSDVVEVYSRPQALSQCRNWLNRHLPMARTIEVTSTSTAAQLALEKQGAAAIASVQAGVHYGLDVLAENIEDNEANVTRFAVIGHESAPRTGNDRTALMFEVEHRPGALADAMNIFKKNKLNLTWIESFPMARPEGGYVFFVELEGHEADMKVRRALAALERKTLRLEILGSFPRGEPVG